VFEFVGEELIERPEGSGFQADDAQAGFGEDLGAESAHGAHADEQDVHFVGHLRVDGVFVAELLELVALGVAGDFLHRVGEGLDDPALGDVFGAEVFLGRVFQPHAGVLEELPADGVLVSAVGRVREEAFLHVGDNEPEQIALFLHRQLVGQFALLEQDQDVGAFFQGE
jgi:hypothetical protein